MKNIINKIALLFLVWNCGVKPINNIEAFDTTVLEKISKGFSIVSLIPFFLSVVFFPGLYEMNKKAEQERKDCIKIINNI